MTTSALVLILFIAWTIALVIVMEVVRTWLALSGKMRANAFTPDNANISPFMQRLSRAHANCLENFPVIGGLLLSAIVSGNTGVTDPLAWVVLGARIVQSSIHVASLSVMAVNLRFTAYAVQIGIAIYWVIGLLRVAG